MLQNAETILNAWTTAGQVSKISGGQREDGSHVVVWSAWERA
jgi:hypothetical protein